MCRPKSGTAELKQVLLLALRNAGSRASSIFGADCGQRAWNCWCLDWWAGQRDTNRSRWSSSAPAVPNALSSYKSSDSRRRLAPTQTAAATPAFPSTRPTSLGPAGSLESACRRSPPRAASASAGEEHTPAAELQHRLFFKTDMGDF